MVKPASATTTEPVSRLDASLARNRITDATSSGRPPRPMGVSRSHCSPMSRRRLGPQISADTAVIGVTGLSAAGFSMARLEEAALSSSMMAVARRTIVLADSSKFGVDAFARVAGCAEVEYLVTDAAPPPDLAAALEQAGVQVLVAPPA